MNKGRYRPKFRRTFRRRLNETNADTWRACHWPPHDFTDGFVAELDAVKTLTFNGRGNSGVNTLFQGGHNLPAPIHRAACGERPSAFLARPLAEPRKFNSQRTF